MMDMNNEEFSLSPDDAGNYWLNGDEGTNLPVDEIDKIDQLGWYISVRSGGRYFKRTAPETGAMFVEVAQ